MKRSTEPHTHAIAEATISRRLYMLKALHERLDEEFPDRADRDRFIAEAMRNILRLLNSVPWLNAALDAFYCYRRRAIERGPSESRRWWHDSYTWRAVAVPSDLWSEWSVRLSADSNRNDWLGVAVHEAFKRQEIGRRIRDEYLQKEAEEAAKRRLRRRNRETIGFVGAGVAVAASA